MADTIMNRTLEELNRPEPAARLEALRALAARRDRGEIRLPERSGLVNNHIHTIYSFSPYSPSAAVWMSLQAGLATAGIMDHDTLSGAGEFLEAGRIAGLAVTVGLECRVDFRDTPLAGRRINNPDQDSNAYVALHGVPHPRIGEMQAFFAPLRAARERRNRRMVERLAGRVEPLGLSLDYEADVAPLSRRNEGGTVTERHILFALAGRMEERFGRGTGLVAFLEREMALGTSPGARERLLDPENPFYRYDLLGVLKSDLVGSFYIDAEEECPPVREVVRFTRELGAIPAYAYLGDVGESVTGDKRPQHFEDGYLELLFEVIVGLGFQAVTYMPSRNSPAQLRGVRELCSRHGLLEISGEDINSPRQSFICRELERPEFGNLIDAAWALIGHERAASGDPAAGLFAAQSVRRTADLASRVRYYRQIAEGGT